MSARYLVFIFSFCCLPIFAQDKLLTFTKEDGLTSNQVTTYLVDSKGVVWIGTEMGINAFSNSKWVPIKSIVNNQNAKEIQLGRVEKIFEDSRQNIWVSTARGLFYYNRKFWTNYKQEDDEGFICKDFFEDRGGKIWIGLEKKKEFDELSKLDITTVNGFIQMFYNEKWFRFDEISGSVALMYNVPPKFFTSFLQDRAGNIWFGTLEGLHWFDGKVVQEIDQNELAISKVFAVIQDQKGDVWAATEKGVFRFHDNIWKKYGKKEGLTGDFIYDLKEDSRGRIWAFSASDMRFTGLNMYDGSAWHSFDPKAIHLKKSVISILWKHDTVFAYSDDGVAFFNDLEWHQFDRKNGLQSSSYSKIFRDRNKNIWLAGDKGFYQYVEGKWKNLSGTLLSDKVSQIYIDKKNNVWIGTNSAGCYKYANGDWNQFSVTNGLSDDQVQSIFEDKNGDIWIITKKGISKTTSLAEQ